MHDQDQSQMKKRPSLDEGDPTNFHPSQFMRARRPELFSDSTSRRESPLTKEIFEYHLATLTARKQEIEFEHFCRRLAEKEICPNLLPQTGPTGGGDSKTDAETYPVADTLAQRWYEGIGREASQERWAFAFSAKAKWRPKINSDVKEIVKTKRNYKVVFFITNQFIKDKTRPQVEKELSKKYKIDVRILDRSWLIKCVFEHDRLRLAQDTLHITNADTAQKILGPNDVERQSDLKELEERINDANRYKGVEYQLAEDCLHAALLARGLEQSRIEVEGRFQRAIRISERVGHRQQRLRIVYSKAWTAFWWYEDFQEFNQLYGQVENLAVGSDQATDLQLLCNLWALLDAAVTRSVLSDHDAKLTLRTDGLKAELRRLAADKKRPNNALFARIENSLIELHEAIAKNIPADSILIDLKNAFEDSKVLTEVSLESTMEVIREFGPTFTNSDAYDGLIEVVANLTEYISSQGEGGLVLLERGFQKLQAGKKYDAIRLLGRAQQKLAVSEYKKEWTIALAGCASAYESSGLLWAARANLLMATNLAISEYWKFGKIKLRTVRYVQRLVWLELQLGRIFQALTWMELAAVLAPHVLLDTNSKEIFDEERKQQDRVLGLLLLKTDLWGLKWLSFLPDILDKAGLYYSWMALLYALGYEDYLRSQGCIAESEKIEDVKKIFIKWAEQPANEDLPDQPELMRSDKITFRSYVIGCEVSVQASNTPVSIYLAETVLAAIEGLLATCLDPNVRLFPYRSELKIILRPSELISGLPEYQINEDNSGPTINVSHALTFNSNSVEDREEFHKWLYKFIIELTFQIAVVEDTKSFANKVLVDELGLERAIYFSDIDVAIGNVLGQYPKLRLADWESAAGEMRFSPRRSNSWNDEQIKKNNEAILEPGHLVFGEGEPPDTFFGIDNIKHKDCKILSLINIPLWDKAQWGGTLYMCYPGKEPILGLAFRNAEAGIQIFKGLHSRIGQVDEREQLRISIIKGIDKKHPASYSVIISSNDNLVTRSKPRYLYFVTRSNRMDPPDLGNLEMFLQSYNQMGRYIIMPAYIKDGAQLEPLWKPWIGKRQLNIREAWQIGENDPDISAIQEGNEPIIPEGILNPPVFAAMTRWRKFKK